MAKIHFNTAFENMSEKDINTWIVFNRKRLVGSAVFTCNDSFTSKVVRWAENWGEKDKEKFTPSHTGSIIEYDKSSGKIKANILYEGNIKLWLLLSITNTENIGR